MALANFFDKAALGAAQILNGFDRTNFSSILENCRIGIAFDKNASSSQEGRTTLDMLVRLVARLYPNLQFEDLSLCNAAHIQELEKLASEINPAINLASTYKPSVYLIVGKTDFEVTNEKKFFIGSDGWVAKFSVQNPVLSCNSANPFGAGAAACFGAANLFRFIFKDYLTKGDLDSDFTFSILELAKDNTSNNPDIKDIDIDETLLVGTGAIGNAVIWALSKIPELSGQLDIIDDQVIDLSNLQRYVLARQVDIDKSKVELAKEFMKGSKLTIIPYPYKWDEYLQKRNSWLIKKIAVCVDSANDRIAVQGALPEKIFNAWTQQKDLGVSRHLSFMNDACLACLYIPDSKQKSKSEIIAESLGLASHEVLVRKYLANHTPVDINLLNLISKAKKISSDDLKDFLGKHLEVFYSEVVCGGVLMRLENNPESTPNIEVPSSFESALAGILLAAELVIDAGKLRNSSSTITRFNLLRPLGTHFHENHNKHHSYRCICQDSTFLDAYRIKWGE